MPVLQSEHMPSSPAAGEFADTILRTQLLERRQRLESAITRHDQPGHLVDLLAQVDAALDRMHDGTYGICKACHEPIELERLVSNPLTELCLSHLSPAEQRALERDLEMAAQIQGALLPKRKLASGGWEIHYHYQPAGLVSGDYCDLVEGAGGDLFFLFGDVAGKGVAASMLTAHLHAMFRALIASELPLSEVVQRSNALFCESTMPSSYATLVCGRAEPGGGLEILNAGHCPPLVATPSGIQTIEATGLPLGLFCNSEYALRRMSLGPGDTLLLYTDGVSEARNSANAEYGAARLARLAAAQRHLAADELMHACLEDLRAFRGGASQADDITLMVVRRN